MKGKEKIQQQKQVTISAYTMEVIQKSFTNTLKWLEHYIDKSGYSGKWERQISESIKRQDLNDQPDEIKKCMETALLALDGVIDDKPDFVFENLQEQFYSWLDKSGIRVNNCSEELAECVVNIYKVLINDGKEFVERVDREASEDIAKMTPEERREKFYKTFILAQKLIDSVEARKKSLEGKTYKDVDTKNKFSGNPDQGKKLFGQIQQSASSGGNPPPLTNPEIVLNVKSYPQNWRIDEIITGYDNYGRATEKQLALIHNSAEVGYDGAVSNLQSQPIYLVSRFNQDERVNIEQALGVSQTPTSQSVRQELVNDILQNIDKWRIENKVVSHNCYGEKWYQGKPEQVLIRQDAEEIKYNQFTGDIIIQPGKLYRVKEDLTEAERKAIGYKSETGLQTSSSSKTPKNDDKSIGKGGIVAIVGVVSALLIGGVVVAKKQLNKKVKK